MRSTLAAGQRGCVAFIALTLLLAISACDGIFGSDRTAFANTARVAVVNETNSPLVLVTSTEFVLRLDPLTGQQQVSFLEPPDTVHITNASFDESYNIQGQDRFLARVANPSLQDSAIVQLRVFLDSRQVYAQRAIMRDAFLQYTNVFVR